MGGDGEPERSATVDHEAVVCLNVQATEGGAAGIVDGGADGLAAAVHLGRKRHIAQIAAADSYAGDGSRSRDAAA